MSSAWPPPIGSRGRLNEPHPWAGHTATVVRYEVFPHAADPRSQLALVVHLEEPEGHEAGVIDAEDFTVTP